jgi:hypothetical protein
MPHDSNRYRYYRQVLAWRRVAGADDPGASVICVHSILDPPPREGEKNRAPHLATPYQPSQTGFRTATKEGRIAATPSFRCPQRARND